MRLLVIAAACALAVAGSASAQTKGYAPTTTQSGDQAQVLTGHTATMPGPAARPATMAGSSVARTTTMARPTHRGAMRHHMRGHRHMGRHHRTHGAAFCGRHAHGRKMSHRAMTHAIERCEAGRHHRHHRHHHRMAHRTTTTTRTTTVTK